MSARGYVSTARTRKALRLCVEALMLAGHGAAACRVEEWAKIERTFEPAPLARGRGRGRGVGAAS